MAFSKTTCPITRSEFRQHAQPNMPVVLNGTPLAALAKEFQTGSLGWNLNGKTTVTINGKVCTCQIGLNVTIVGSKELPQDEAAAA